MSDDLSYDYLVRFKQDSAALRMLSSPLFPLLAGFFFQAFIRKNRRSVAYQELIAELDYFLMDIRETHGDDKYPKPARSYIDDWVNQKPGYLRKYMPQQSDEPECDLLPDVEKAIRWLQESQNRQFVGTESRLNLVIDLIEDLVHGTSEDIDAKLINLRQQKAELEQQIQAVEQGMDTGYTATQIRERMFLVADMSRQLLSDFRQVESNFRQLDRNTRKTITLAGEHKGKVLDEVFSGQDVIENSDEGSSFSAFFELLMSAKMRENLRQDLRHLLTLEETREFALNDELLLHLYAYLLEAGSKVNQTRQQITEQLRRYIQEQSQDNRRILQLIRTLEEKTHQLDRLPEDFNIELDGYHAAVSTLFSRHIYLPQEKEILDSKLEPAEADQAVDLNALFEISHVDEVQLQRNIRQCLQHFQGQATLAQIVEKYPVEQGLDEVLTYLKIACEQQVHAHIDERNEQLLRWQAAPEVYRQISFPLVTFIRNPSS